MEKEDKIQKAFEFVNEFKELASWEDNLPLMLGQMFKESQDNKYLKTLNIDERDFFGEIGISKKRLYARAKLYTSLNNIGYEISELSGCNFDRLNKVRKAFLDKEDVLKITKDEFDIWVEKCKPAILSATNFTEELREATGGEIVTDHDCNAYMEEKVIHECTQCHSKTFN